jgi:hypothetical protein
VSKAIARIDPTGPLRKARSETSLPRRIRCYACGSVTPVRAQGSSIRLRLQRVGLRRLLPTKRSLLPRLLDLLTSLRSLRCGNPAQLAILTPAQGAFGALLLTRIELGLRSCLYIGTRLRGSLSLLSRSARLGDWLSLLS